MIRDRELISAMMATVILARKIPYRHEHSGKLDERPKAVAMTPFDPKADIGALT
jgi:hypothetical protein